MKKPSAGRLLPRSMQDSNLSRMSAVALGVVSGLLLGWVIMVRACVQVEIFSCPSLPVRL